MSNFNVDKKPKTLMTSQNSENNNRSSSSSSSTPNNNNSILGQTVLMKEKDRNKINNNNNILLLNQASITSNYNVNLKTQASSTFVQIKPTTSDQSTKNSEDCLFDSDIEIIDDYEEGGKDQKLRKERKVKGSNNKKETPLLQIFDGNVVISQELSIEEVQNLLTQINSKLQNQNSVNSADFPNITFSKEENSDVEIILDDANDIELNKNEGNLQQSKVLKSGKWIGQALGSNKSKVLLKSLSVGDKVAELYDQPSTSTESNLLIAFRKAERSFEHDYSSQKLINNDDVNSKEDEPMVEHVIVENSGAELMQIELIEPANGSSGGSVIPSNCATDKGKTFCFIVGNS